jgi:hypothetical protein
MGERTLNKSLLSKKLDALEPKAIAKWEVASGVSKTLLLRIRNGYVPPKDSTRWKAASALGVTEDDLFPRPVKRLA